jgi:uncharacterized protein
MAQLLLTVGLLAAFCLPSAWAESVPELKGRVNDYAQMLSPAAEGQLEIMLVDLERTDGTQMAVLTIDSLEGRPIEEFSIQVAEKWGIGQKQNDNGALLVIAKNDRKLRIEVGYGLEGRLTDLATGRIIRNIIGPQFKTGRFDQGVIDGVTAMIATARGEYTAPESPSGGGERQDSPGVFGLIVFFFLVNVVGRVNRLMGGLAGAVLAPIGGLLFGWGALALLVLIPVGFMAGFLVSLFGPALSFGHGSHRSRGGTSWGGGGGFSSGGGFGGFSGGGGGFGGGGSSGSW